VSRPPTPSSAARTARTALLAAGLWAVAAGAGAEPSDAEPGAEPSSPETPAPPAADEQSTPSRTIFEGDAVRLGLGGQLQLWWTVHEQNENGLLQPLSSDEAAQEASGFSIRRARLWTDLETEHLRARLSLRLEGSPPGLLDAYLAVPLYQQYIELWGGQMKIPSTYEVGLPSADLDFVTRSLLSQRATDLALSQSPSLSSPRFNGVRTYLRDVGVGLKGRVLGGRYFLMVGNGFGANQFIGGSEFKQEIYSNSFGAYFYAGRLGYEILPRAEDGSGDPVALELGGHFSWNEHPDVVLDDERTVLDVRRRSWSGDLRLWLGKLVKLTGLFGGGAVLDDLDNDDKDDYAYRGWEGALVLSPLPGTLDFAHRYEGFAHERYENGAVDTLHVWTLGASWTPLTELKLQLNYKWKMLDSDREPERDDNALLLMAQGLL